MRVHMNKFKVMISGERQKPVQKAARWMCGACGRGVGSNSIQRTSCHLRTIVQICRAISSQLRHISAIGNFIMSFVLLSFFSFLA